MCGFFGWISKKELSQNKISISESCLYSLKHRGPDDFGIYKSLNFFIGHRRLSIIDISRTASQPFFDASNRYALSFNGEIYNYLELRIELEKNGISFNTKSDTEVLMHALIYWGRDAFNRIDGMYAGSFYDKKTNGHIFFRDPTGQKPFYYFCDDDQFIYSSELRGILSIHCFKWRINKEAFSRFLLHGYYALEDTPIIGIKKLLPGHYLEYINGTIKITSFSTPCFSAENEEITENEAIIGTENRLFNSCIQTLRADVPSGIFLSGGLDSSIIASMSKKIDPNIQTFSIGVDDPEYDETKSIVKITNSLGIENPLIFRMGRATVNEAMDYFLNNIDEPHGDPGFVNMLLLSQRSSSHIKVALSGDGGDELFAGYASFKGVKYTKFFNEISHDKLNFIKIISNYLPDTDGYLSLKFKLNAYLRGFPSANKLKPMLWLSSMETSKLSRLIKNNDFKNLFAPVEDVMDGITTENLTQELLYYYQKVFLPEFICHHTDRASMQYGLEVRAPFLSKEVIKYVNELPNKYKIKGGSQKFLLKKIAEFHKIPLDIIHQKKKGFSIPLSKWLKNIFLAETISLQNCPELHDLINNKYLEDIIQSHIKGSNNNYRIIFSLMSFRHWRKKYPSIGL